MTLKIKKLFGKYGPYVFPVGMLLLLMLVIYLSFEEKMQRVIKANFKIVSIEQANIYVVDYTLEDGCLFSDTVVWPQKYQSIFTCSSFRVLKIKK